jgi:hypothetical protein
MGTNFFVRGWKSTDRMDPKFHIGKRSAAGLWCWDCGVTLNKLGDRGVHHSCQVIGHDAFCNCGWYKSCPKCGKKPVNEGLSHSSAGRELGFNHDQPKKKTGVQSCSSFSWCMDPEVFLKKRVTIWNEYGDNFSRDEFLAILKECPIQSKGSIGQWFS